MLMNILSLCTYKLINTAHYFSNTIRMCISRNNIGFERVYLAVSKSCNRTEFGQSYDNSKMGQDRIYGKWGVIKAETNASSKIYLHQNVIKHASIKIKIGSLAHYTVFLKIA